MASVDSKTLSEDFDPFHVHLADLATALRLRLSLFGAAPTYARSSARDPSETRPIDLDPPKPLAIIPFPLFLRLAEVQASLTTFGLFESTSTGILHRLAGTKMGVIDQWVACGLQEFQACLRDGGFEMRLTLGDLDVLNHMRGGQTQAARWLEWLSTDGPCVAGIEYIMSRVDRELWDGHNRGTRGTRAFETENA